MSTVSVDENSPSYSQSLSGDQSSISPQNLKKTLSTPSMFSQGSKTPADLGNAPGFRAAEAYVRPCPIATVGNNVSYGFDLRNCTFTFSLTCEAAATDDAPTEIFLPEFHFPRDNTEVVVSGGKWSISVDDAHGGLIQRLRWWHGEGSCNMKATGVKRRQGMALGKEEEEGYLDRCQQSRCNVM